MKERLKLVRTVGLGISVLAAGMLLVPPSQASAQCNDCISQVHWEDEVWEHWFGNRPPGDPTPEYMGDHSDPVPGKCSTFHVSCWGGGQHQEEQEEQLEVSLAQLDAQQIGLSGFNQAVEAVGLRLVADDRSGDVDVLTCSLAVLASFTIHPERLAELRLNAHPQG